uniref:Zinc finger and AT hook domain containing n=1 Tax=Oncorhynchus mykiss TaxID=8022 RepID=A0A8C7LXQ6_ONCMY
MCKLCNLFSPHRAQLLSHVSEKHHTEGLNPDDIIVALMPLTGPLENGGDSPVKRKRGRPKGSTKKIVADGPMTETTKAGPVDEEEPEDNNALDCKKCNRVFGNRRQIMKHICLMDLREDEDQEEDNDKEFEAQPGAAEGKEEDRERSSKRPRPLRSERVSLVKEQEPAGGPKNPIISVVLTAHEALPGATRIVPIEATPAEPVAPADTDPQEAGQKRGFQEYSIQQAAYEVPLKSNRIGQTQLKIFTCEYCNKVFKFRHSLQAHLRTHTNEKPFKCPHCDYASAIKANLSVHLRKHTGEKFSCEHCSFQCLSKGHLKVHVERVHHKIKQHCLFCKKKYSDVKNLLKHMRESHDLEDKKVKDSYHEYSLQTREGKRQLLYDCQICDRKFKNELDRDRHMMVHGSERPFGCELCDHGCTKFQALQAHVRKHPFLYVCAACQQKFVSSVRLKAHLKEAHPESEEAVGFSESINSSFCLLEPGDDIKREMLRQDEIRMAEELSLLNAQQEEEEAFTGDPSEEQEALAGDPSEEQEEALAGDPSEEQEEALAGDPSEEQEEEEAFAGDPSEEQEEHPEEEKGSSSTSQGHVEETLRSLVLIQGEVIGQTNASAGPQGEDGTTEERSAFQQILDKLQKRQLNMVVFDRIRKVYGDLECEYCAGLLLSLMFYVVPRLGKLFWYQVHYNMHVRTHTKEHLHYCTQCSYSSITKNCLKRHLIQRHSNILLQCPMEHCQYCTPDKYKLQAHLKTHFDNEKKSFACPVCEETFTEDKLKHHIKSFHPDTPMNTISEALGVRVQVKGLIGKRASKCPYCDSYFMRNGADLQQHIWAHQGVKPFKCSLCDYASRSKSNLKAHMSRHTTEKTHLCDMCGKKFKSKVTLKSHKLMHTEDGKQFQCTECDYSAAQKPLLVRHMEQHASFKPYRCGHCHYSCNIAGPLKRHYSKKHPNQAYCNAGPGPATSEAVEQQGGVKCPVCDYVYGTKWEMNRHLKNKHGLKVIQSDVVEQSVEEPLTQYLHITETEDPQGTEAAVSALQDLRFTENEGLDPTAVNILQQIIELGAESNDATAASMVAMVPGRVTVVEQVAEEEEQGSHTVMIQDPFQQAASMELGEEHHLVVSSDDVEGMETVTVYTQGEDASQFIVYVQEAVQTEEHTVESI